MLVFTELTIATWGVAGFVLIGAAAWFWQSLRRERSERRRMHQAQRLGLHLPASLHPVIDPQICIGSAACVAACPEGDVLGLVQGAGRLIHGAACVGHGRCAAECPVGAIRLVFGTTERGADIPFLTPDYETSRSGIYVAGELGGMGLIRNAIRQGIGAARHALATRAKKRPTSGGVDIAIVGAGPAGIGAALACIEAGVSYALLEQETLGGTVAHYPRQKVVMTEPVEVPIFGRIHRAEMSKEDLLQLWQRIATETGLVVRPGARVMDIQGENSSFQVITAAGPLAAQKVVLAIGRRGTPRRLGVPGENSERVTYRLVDPEQYLGGAVLVVGGGDSALEAAIALAETEGVRAALCYRGEGFFRAKEKNRQAIERLTAARRLKCWLQTAPTEIRERTVLLKTPTGIEEVTADFVVAATGGDAPTDFLQKVGIRVDRWFGAPPAGNTHASTRIAHAHSQTVRAWPIYLGACLGAVALAGLWWVGRKYYGLVPAARELSPLHGRLRSSGVWGHGIGVIATLVMWTNFFYAARKRWRWLQGAGGLSRWLSAHVLVGLLTPPIIAFHAAFQMRNLVATTTYAAVAAVVVTGVVGRYVYGRIQVSETFVSGATAMGFFKSFMKIWRSLHVLLAILMVVTILIHVSVSWLLGYRWILSR